MIFIKKKEFNFKVTSSKCRIPPRILDLKDFMSDFLEKTRGIMDPEEREKNDMIISVLKAVKFMVSHGFFVDAEKLSRIAQHVVELLNGGKGVKKIKRA